MTHAHRLKMRCFLEGIEIPIISCSVNVTPNAPAQFQVQIPATDRSLEFLPRTLVHVFIYDYWEGASPTESVRCIDQVITEEEMLAELAQRAQERSQYYEEHTATPSEFLPNPFTAESRPSPFTGEAAALAPSSSAVSSAQVLPEEGAPSAAALSMMPDASGSTEESFRDSPFVDEDSHWKFFIGGEVIGFEFTKTAGNRDVILHCLDWSVYWDTCYQYKVNVANLTGDGTAAFVGAGTTFQDTFFSSTTSTIVNAVMHRSVTQPHLTGLLGGVVRLLESVGGVYIGNESQSINGPNPQNLRNRFKGVNDFFSIAELRLKLVYMITAAEGDETSRQSFARQAFSMWGRRYASRLGQIASFREILNVMMQYIFHSVFPIPAPKFVQPQDRLRTSRSTTTSSFASSPQGQQFLNDLRGLRNTAQYARDRMRRSTGYSVAGIRSQLYSVETQCQRKATQSAGFGDSGPAQSLTEAVGRVRQIRTLYPAGGDDSSSYAIYQRNRSAIDSGMERVITAIDTARGYYDIAVRSRTSTTTRTVQTGRRLNMEVVRPDIFMCSPPRCNVIFPELSSSMQFTRMFLQEVTRMRLTVSDEIFGPNALLNNIYYAPDVEVMGAFGPRQVRGQARDEARTLSRAQYSKRIMEHELFTGIVPVFERLNEVNIYAARTDEVSYRGARIPFVVRAVNHQFFKARWAQRQMHVAGKFNPYVVPGFPAVIMDRYMTREQVEASELRGYQYLERSGRMSEAVSAAEEFSGDPPPGGTDMTPLDYSAQQYDAWRVLKENVPTQFVGLVEGLNHVVTQSNAGTSVTLTHARTHRENEELLGANREELTSRSLLRRQRGTSRRTVGTPGGGSRSHGPVEGRAVRTTPVAAIDPPQIGMVGPYFGEVTAVSPSTVTGSLPLFGTFFGDRVRRQWREFPVGVELRARDLGDEVVTQFGDPEHVVILRAYSVTEAIDRWRGQEVDVPLEDFIRPPWMADVWRNDRIGATYQQFFGTGSITDASIINAGNVLASSAGMEPVDEFLSYAEAEERERNVQDPIRASGASSQRPGTDINIERAIDLLVRSYSAIKHNGLDVHEFIRAYTWRPAATLPEMLGSRDLEIDADGNVTSGEEGLHSRAFGHGELGSNLRNLLSSDVRQILGFNTEEDRGQILERMDKRAEKAERIMAYVEELWNQRGLLG
jgi:hypothetical protein